MPTDADYAALHIGVAIIGALVLIALVAWSVQRWRWRRLERASAPALPPAEPAPSAPPAPLAPRDPDYWRPRKVLLRILRLLVWPITGEVRHRRPPEGPFFYMRRDEGGGGGM